jgi:hypothetical protein
VSVGVHGQRQLGPIVFLSVLDDRVWMAITQHAVVFANLVVTQLQFKTSNSFYNVSLALATLGPPPIHRFCLAKKCRRGRSCDKYSHATVHYKTLYMYSLQIPIRTFPSEGRTTWVRRYCNISKGFDAYCTAITSQYVLIRTMNLISQMTRQARFPMQNVIPRARRAASLDY